MNPDTRMATSLILSLALSATNLRMAAAGKADIVDVGIRYVVGFVVCFFLVGVVGGLFNAYLRQTQSSEMTLAGTGGTVDANGGDRSDAQTAASSDT